MSFSVTVTDTVAAGDMDGSGTLDLKDAVLLRRAIAGGWNVEPDRTQTDVDMDGAVNLRDVAMLLRFLAGGWNVQLGSPTLS